MNRFRKSEWRYKVCKCMARVCVYLEGCSENEWFNRMGGSSEWSSEWRLVER